MEVFGDRKIKGTLVLPWLALKHMPSCTISAEWILEDGLTLTACPF